MKALKNYVFSRDFDRKLNAGILIGLLIINIGFVGFVTMPLFIKVFFKAYLTVHILQMFTNQVNRVNFKKLYNEFYDDVW